METPKMPAPEATWSWETVNVEIGPEAFSAYDFEGTEEAIVEKVRTTFAHYREQCRREDVSGKLYVVCQQSRHDPEDGLEYVMMVRRWETAQEHQERMDQTIARLRMTIEDERAEYQRLKAKFEGGER